MGMLLKFFQLGILPVIAVLLGSRLVKIAFLLGVNRNTFKHHPGPCKVIQGINSFGSESVTVLSTGEALFTSNFIWSIGTVPEQYAKLNGKIYKFDYSRPEKATELIITGDLDMKTFNPLGIGAWEEDGEVRIFVVNVLKNAGKDISQVEIFQYTGGNELKLIKTIQAPEFISGNDIAATGADSFYLTNFIYRKQPPWSLLEMFLELRWGNIVYFDGKIARVVKDGLHFPNGVDVNDKRLYVTTSQSVISYKVESNFSLSEVDSFFTGTWLDNVKIDKESNDIYVGRHPVPLLLLMWERDPTIHVPSQVLRLKTNQGKFMEVSEIFSDDGSMITACSVGARYKDRLFVGSIHHKAIYCDIHE